MLKGLYTAYTGMVHEQNRMDVLTNNLANSDTVGYKKEGATAQSFDTVLIDKIKDDSEVAALPRRIGIANPGVKIGEGYTDFSEGPLQVTENTYDFAIGGDGFFTIEFTNKNDETFTMEPRCFVFGAKASPGYYRAKQIIRFINALSRLIAKHPRASKYLQVVFLENYDVGTAEILIPAAEVSEQLSTASKEASGTGNMKYMMNGAVTIGTMDGANVEISQQVGMDNIYIFGMRSDTVRDMYLRRDYNPMQIFETNQEIRQALTQMIDGTLFPEYATTLQDLYHSLLLGDGGMADNYFVLKDFGSYSMAQRRLNADYADREKWLKMAITNTAMSGVFSSDRTISEYNDNIWHLDPLKRKA